MIAFPTDTVYGLGVVYDDEAALQRLKTAKGRPETKPIPTMAASSAQIEEVAIVDERSKKLIDAFMPGAFTLILPKQPSAPAYVSNGMDTIAVRIPDDPFVLELLKQVGKPMLVTSANLSDQPAATTGIEALGQLDGRIDGIVMGASGASAASTILDVTKTEWQILRCGAVSEEQIEAVIGEKRKMRVALACDHGALEYKEILKKNCRRKAMKSLISAHIVMRAVIIRIISPKLPKRWQRENVIAASYFAVPGSAPASPPIRSRAFAVRFAVNPSALV